MLHMHINSTTDRYIILFFIKKKLVNTIIVFNMHSTTVIRNAIANHLRFSTFTSPGNCEQDLHKSSWVCETI